MRTMPCPGFFISIISVRRGPSFSMTTPMYVLRHIDHQLLVGLQPLAIGAQLGDDPGPGDLELESLPPHGLHEDAEVELAPAGHGVGVGAVGLLHPERHVALQLPVAAGPAAAGW